MRSVFSTEIKVIAPPEMGEKEFERLVEDLFEPLEDAVYDVILIFRRKVTEIDPRLKITVNAFEV